MYTFVCFEKDDFERTKNPGCERNTLISVFSKVFGKVCKVLAKTLQKFLKIFLHILTVSEHSKLHLSVRKNLHMLADRAYTPPPSGHIRLFLTAPLCKLLPRAVVKACSENGYWYNTITMSLKKTGYDNLYHNTSSCFQRIFKRYRT